MALDLKNIDFKKIEFKNVYEWPIYGRAVVLGLVCIAVFYLGYFFDFSEIGGKIFSKFQQEQDLKQQVKSILNTEEDMKASVVQYPEFLKLLSQWQGQLINSANLPDLMNQILKLGAANQIQFSLFAPGAKTQQEDYYRVPIKVVMQGSFEQLSNFLSQVANLSQLVAIGNFVILKQQGTGKEDSAALAEARSSNRLTGDLTLEVYYLANQK